MLEKNRVLHELSDTSSITRLGEGLLGSGLLSDEGMGRALSVLKGYAAMAESLGVQQTICYGTAALREARNRDDFIRRVEKETGLHIRVLSEYEEAYYTYLSVRYSPNASGEDFIVVDIGGGSTEIIEGSRDNFGGYRSLPIGTVKLTEKCVHHDPPLPDELISLTDVIGRHLSAVRVQQKGRVIVGVGGTMTTLAAIVLELHDFDKEKIEGLNVPLSAINEWIERMARMTKEERLGIAGMERGREDLLMTGIIFMREIISLYGAESVTISTYGGRYGVIYEMLGKG